MSSAGSLPDGGHDACIRALVAAYAEHMDAGDFEAVGALFARATLRNAREPGRVVAAGSAEVAALLRRSIRLYEGRPGEQHLTTNTVVHVDDDHNHASARSVYVVLMAAPGFPLQVTGAGRYHDRFRRDAAWHFTDRLFIQDQIGDVSAHAKGGLPS